MQYVIHLVEDNKALAAQWSLLWSDYSYQTIIYNSGIDFLQRYKKYDIECILIDIWLPGGNGDKLFDRLLQNNIFAPCIFWSGDTSIAQAVTLMRNGAFNVLEKRDDASKIKNTLDEAFEECIAIYEKKNKFKAFKEKLQRLTPKEKDVFNFIIQNKSVDETAHTRNVSPRTVTEQRKQIFKKLDIPSAQKLYIYCRDIGYNF